MRQGLPMVTPAAAAAAAVYTDMSVNMRLQVSNRYANMHPLTQ